MEIILSFSSCFLCFSTFFVPKQKPVPLNTHLVNNSRITASHPTCIQYKFYRRQTDSNLTNKNDREQLNSYL